MEHKLFNLEREVNSIRDDIDQIMEMVKSLAEVQDVEDVRITVDKLYKKVSIIEAADVATSEEIVALSDEVKDLRLVITGFKLDFDRMNEEFDTMSDKVERNGIILMIVVGGTVGLDKIIGFF